MTVQIINCYGKKRSLFREPLSRSLALNRTYRKFVASHFDLDDPPLFGHVQVETSNYCSFDCPFCPVNRNANKRGRHKLMPDALVFKIAKELGELDFEGKLSVYNNNEPLLDRRICRIIKTFRRLVPKATIVLMTNGTALNEKKTTELARSGLDHLIVDNYSDTLELAGNLKRLVENVNRGNIDIDEMNFKILLRKKNEILSNRAGNAPNKTVPDAGYKKLFCVYPFVQFNINPDGQATICCYDAFYENVLGEVKKNKIIDVWRNQKYRKTRQKILKSRRTLVPCFKCDFNGVFSESNKKNINFSILNNRVVWKKVPHV
ncbi:MAG: radical SAM/SPASM domain-containing protein [Candidatus Micrarchaeota archaeon]